MERVAPEIVFTILGIPIRDTVVSTWIMIAIVVLLAYVVGRLRPAALELLVDFINDTISGLMGRPAGPYLPFLGALAIFIAASNVLGIIPGLLAPTRDLNAPLGLALVVFFSVHYYGIREHGIVDYLRDLASPVYLLPLEIITQISRTISLSLRLFGNIVSAELIVAIIFALLPVFVPLPLIGLGIFTGLLQAYIFTALATVYIAGAVQAREM